MTRYRKFRTIAALVATLGLAAGHVSAQTDDKDDFPWDFSGKRQPQYVEILPEAEGELCAGYTDRYFRHYRETYPRFAEIPDQNRAKRKLRRAYILNMAEQKSATLVSCMYLEMWRKVRGYLNGDEIYRVPFCPYEGAPQTAKFREALADLEELTEYALRGHAPALVIVKNMHGDIDVRVSPDVRYMIKLYLVELAKRRGNTEPPYLDELDGRYVLGSEKELTPMRREFIEEAFARGEWKAVLGTIDPCAPELETSES